MFEAPFIEFDAYRMHTASGRGGRYYNLMLQHRYSNTQAVDRKSGRDSFFWRNMTNDQWREEHEGDYEQRMQDADFSKYHCQACILDARIQGRGLPLPYQPRGLR